MIERAAELAALGAECRRRLGRKCHSYADESFAGIGRSTPRKPLGPCSRSNLPAARNIRRPSADLDYLCERQRPDGTWDEPECTGTGFPRDFYINYHLYRHLFPTMALATDVALETLRANTFIAQRKEQLTTP